MKKNLKKDYNSKGLKSFVERQNIEQAWDLVRITGMDISLCRKMVDYQTTNLIDLHKKRIQYHNNELRKLGVKIPTNSN